MIKITFKKFAKNYIPKFIAWSQKPHVQDTWFQEGHEPLTMYYEKATNNNGYDYPFIIYLDSEPIGYIQCSDLYAYKKLCPKTKGVFTNEEPGTFCLDLFIGEDNYLNKGYGTKIVKVFVDKIFKDFKAKKILVDPACSNKRAIRCYEKAGFKFIRKELNGTTECCIMQFIRDDI